MNKKVLALHKAHAPHWVGDGLPVRNVFSYTDLGRSELSPFLMLDYGSPAQFPPTNKKLGVGMHPHRGFETVTLVYQGQLEHRDTAGNHGEIGPGDVQWMTAGSGVLHEEKHAEAFSKSGGTLQMAQLWVNLPARVKMTAPKYQTLLNKDIPTIETNDGTIRLIAGNYSDAQGPADTFTPINILDVKVNSGHTMPFSVPQDFTTAVFIVEGAVTIDGTTAESTDLLQMERSGSEFAVTAINDAHIIILNGAPIDEPVVGYGPFVMNTQAEIVQAFNDFRSGVLS